MPGKYDVLIVDDEMPIRRLLEEHLSLSGYACQTAGSYEAARQMLERHEFDVIITDIYMPGRSGLELVRELVEMNRGYIVIVVTGVGTLDTAVKALRLGAYDYFTKPIKLSDIIPRVEEAISRRQAFLEDRFFQRQLRKLVSEKTEELGEIYKKLAEAYELTIAALGAALDLRDSETRGHAGRVTRYSELICRELKIPEAATSNIRWGSYLHDIGKVGIPDSVLWKPGKLSTEEWVIMKRHSALGHELLKGIPFLERAAEIVLTHHERYDGSGYPRGLRGEEIPIGARIFAVADAFDAITTDRPYQHASTAQAARQHLVSHTGRLFDPDIVTAFLSIPEDVVQNVLLEHRSAGPKGNHADAPPE